MENETQEERNKKCQISSELSVVFLCHFKLPSRVVKMEKN